MTPWISQHLKCVLIQSVAVVLMGCFSATGAMAQSDPAARAPTLELESIAPQMQCTDLSGVRGLFSYGSLRRITNAEEVRDTDNLPYCRVEGYIAPQIHFEIQMPLKGWNQRYLQNGCGGYCGTVSDPNDIDASAGCVPAETGAFVRSSTDDGHTTPFNHSLWGVDNPQAQVDLGYRAVHELAVTAKTVIEAFYGQGPAHSYFSGCSDGGREGLMEAQRYPEDFDGIIAGAPANIWSPLNGIFQPWVVGANTDENGDYIIPPAKMSVLAEAAMNSCDARDGLDDNLIQDPRACDFDPASLQCTNGTDEPDCLTGPEVEAARKIYQAPHGPSGEALYPGSMPVGSERAWAGAITAPPGQRAVSEGYATYRRYLDPDVPVDSRITEWQIDEAELKALRDRMGRIYDSTDPDLSAFREHGGKLIMWHGWADQAIPPHGTIAYWEAVAESMGEDARDQFTRLYMIPGLYHCRGGELDNFDFLTAVMNWVEQDTPPERITAWTEEDGEVTRSRPLFPYPAMARYDGTGSIDAAENFTAAGRPDDYRDAYDWAGSFDSGYQRVCGWTGPAFTDGQFVCQPMK